MSNDRVKVALDATVPQRFGPRLVGLRSAAGDEAIALGNVTIAMVGGHPHFERVEVESPAPIDPAVLGSIDWHRAAWEAVEDEYLYGRATRDALASGETSAARLLDRTHAIERAADEARRYNRLTREQLDEVAELWRSGGATAVADRFCVSRRQADRYVSKAREAGALS